MNDYIYSKQDFDSSPIVIESHKLIFFTVTGVGDVTWRCLFRRMLGYADWRNTTSQFEGLRYLYDYNVSRATEMMTSPDYTRAMFVRDPKVRLLSNFLEYVRRDKVQSIRWLCCGGHGGCANNFMDFPTFVDSIATCDEPYWRPQGRRMEPKYYPLLTIIGHYSRMKGDAQRLLHRIGAWEDYGRSGWGPSGEEPIFRNVSEISKRRFLKYFPPDIAFRTQKRFVADYGLPLLNLTRKTVLDTGALLDRN
jgi:hypothetical protein